jgi:outer membrane protein OmpA-like peptidoglycan-associated protein
LKFKIYIALLLFGILVSHGISAQTLEQHTLSIHFDSDKSDLTENHHNEIRKAILFLGFARITEIYIEGHTDEDHTDQYNIELSTKRASNVQTYLLGQGVPSHLIKTEAFGEGFPLGPDKSLNRRSVITFVYKTDDNISNDPVWVNVKIIDAKSKRPVRSDLIVDKKGKVEQIQTAVDGTSSFRYNPSTYPSQMIAGAGGYLNYTLDLNALKLDPYKDSLNIVIELDRVKVVQKLSFKNIYFYTDSDSLKPESAPDLNRLLLTMKHFDKLYIEIQGHMNYPITRPMTPLQRSYNYELSYKRAKAIYGYLVSNGINPERLTYRGYGNSRMIYPDPKSRGQEDVNKRVEIWTLQKLDPKKLN